MGSRGPAPKRSSERRRRNAESRADKAKASGSVRVPACPKTAHAIAARWYADLKRSAQAQYFEPSDWAAALLVVEQLSRLLVSNEPIAGSAFAGIWAAMGDLFTTEASRRRARIEVERRDEADDEPPPGISAIDDFRKRMTAQ